MTVAAASNGVRPHIDLDDVLGVRAAVRDVTLAGRTYQFRPINLFTAKLLEDEKVEEAFRALIIGGEDEATAFMESAPAQSLGDIVVAVYGGEVLGEASAPSPTSRPKKAASKPSKRTSPRKR